ncbi:MAG: Calx-beta domain-containing protein, partial [Pirellulales bacterium]
KKGNTDTRWGIRVAIGGSSNDWLKFGAGGVAYLTSFNWDSDTPTFVFSNELGGGWPKYVAEAVSHEVGHTLGLRHDGRTSPSEGYYTGHGSGATGWAPIMGVGYYRNLVQWSNGEYLNADNKEDDLKIITTDNGFGYRPDDYGNFVATAFAPQNLGTTPTTFAGVVSQSSDVDVFEVFTTGTLKAVVVPDGVSPDLDILAEIWDSTGTVIATSNPLAALDASFDLKVAAGTYYVAIRGTGKGDRLSTGYTNYGSIGQYTVALAVTNTFVSVTPLAATRDEDNTGTTPFTFMVTRRGDSTATATVDWAVTGSGANAASASDFAGGVFPAGKVAFAAGEESKVVAVPVAGDYLFEADEGFTFTLSGFNGGVLGTSSAQGKIVNDDPRSPTLSIAAAAAVRAEGNSDSTPFTFTVTRYGDPSTPVTALWSATGAGAAPTDPLDFADGLPPGGAVEFAAGETTKTIIVNVNGDTVIEADEGFVVTLSGSVGGVIDVSTAAGTILNDDFPPPKVSVSAANAVKPEGNVGSTAFLFTVTRTGDLAGPTTVRWVVEGSGERPASPDDFAAGVFPAGVVTFTAGETTKTIAIGVAGDSKAEGDERFRVTLAEPAGATIDGGTADGVILNDDAVTSWLSIAAATAIQREGDLGSRPFTFSVLRSGSLANAAMVNWSVAGSGTNPASADDFVDGVFPSGAV